MPLVRNSTVEVNGERFRLLRRHPEEREIWVVKNLGSKDEQFFSDVQLNAGRVVSKPQKDREKVPDSEAKSQCHFCKRNFRYRKYRQVCRDCRYEGKEQCWFCGVFTDNSSAHAQKCAIMKRHSCSGCSSLRYPRSISLKWDKVKGFLCLVCIQGGMSLCKGCTRVYRKAPKRDDGSGKPDVASRYRYCERCHPLPKASVWHKFGTPFGGPPIVETRSWRTFGVELEVYRLPNKAKPGIRLHTPRNWHKGTDGSIIAPRSADAANEFRSPPFFGDKGLDQLRIDILNLRRQGWRANKSTGIHVHVDVSDLSKEDIAGIKKYALWYEQEIFDFVAPSRKDNNYCLMLNNESDRDRRYIWLNFEAVTKFRTIEFRLHHGTTRAKRIKEWTRLCLGFIEAGIRYGRLSKKPSDKKLLDTIALDEDQKQYWEGVKIKMLAIAQREGGA